MPRPSRFVPGAIYGRLTAKVRSTGPYAWYQCSCGAVKETRIQHVLSGRVQSCGCLHHEIITENARVRSTKHGKYGTAVYAIWNSMNSRCRNPHARAYKDYGGRGIHVCDRWKQFENFYEDMGDPPAGMSLDRINNEAGYSKENCRWANYETQSNNKRSNVLITYEGVTQTISQWAKQLGMPRSPLYDRKRAGWSDTDILTKPIRPKHCDVGV